MSRWFRHYAGMMRDEKLVSVAIKSKQPVERVLWIWGAILESAAEIDDHGRFDVDPAEVAYFLRADEDDVGTILAALASAGRLAGDCVVKWGDRQFQSDRSKTRVAAHRERKRAELGGCDGGETPGNTDVTLQVVSCNAPETEAETETKEEENRGRERPVLCPVGVETETFKDFKRQRKTAFTPTALNRFEKEADRAGWTLQAAFEEAVARGWQSFKADWVKESTNGKSNPAQRGGSTASAANLALQRLGHR